MSDERHHVLLVEDDDLLAGLLARLLRELDCDVFVIDACEDLPTGDELERFDLVLAERRSR
jgi:DNA-binding response OmpR family regulator